MTKEEIEKKLYREITANTSIARIEDEEDE